MKTFYDEYFVASNMQLSIVGDINSAQAKQLADELGNKLAIGSKPPLIPLAVQASLGNEIRIPFDSKQAHVYVAQLAIGFNDPDYFPLYVGNHILGGSGFGSRLLEEVARQARVRLQCVELFRAATNARPFIVGFQTRIDQADDA